MSFPQHAELIFADRRDRGHRVLDLVALETIDVFERIVPRGAPFSVTITTPPHADELDDVLMSWAESSAAIEFSRMPNGLGSRGWVMLETMDAIVLLQTVESPLPPTP